MKLKFLFIALFTTNLWAGMSVDYSCKIKQRAYDAVKIRKKNNNVLHLALKLDPSTCTVNSKEPFVMYWTLEGEAKNGVTPCQAVSSYEYQLMGLHPSNASRLNSHQVSIHYPKMFDIAQDFNHTAEEFFEVEVLSTSKGCQLNTTLVIDQQAILLDELKLKMSVFTIKGIDLLLENELVYSF